MAFTNLNLTIQQLLESTFIADMRLMINANDATLASTIQNIVNTFEFDLVNKNIGVDNYLNQVKTNNIILGNSVTFMNSTNVIASLTQVSQNGAVKSNFALDQILIQPGGFIDSSGTGNQIVSTQLGIGLTRAQLTSALNGGTVGLFVGSNSVSVPASFYGSVSTNQAITQSTSNPSALSAVSVNGGSSYYCELQLFSTSTQFMYLSINLPAGATGSSPVPIYIFVYENIASNPNPGQTFTIVINGVYLSDGVTPVDINNWGTINLAQGYDLNTIPANSASTAAARYPVVLNNAPAPTNTVNTASAAIGVLNSSGVSYVQFFNSSIDSNSTLNPLSASVSLTKYNNTAINNNQSQATKWAKYVITNSHNISILAN